MVAEQCEEFLAVLTGGLGAEIAIVAFHLARVAEQTPTFTA